MKDWGGFMRDAQPCGSVLFSYFYRALDVDTTRADLYYQMASVYFDIGTDQCVDMASRAIAIDSTYSAPYQLLGDWFARDDFYALSQRNATAAAYYTRYLSLEPDDVDAVTKLGAVLLRMEDQQAIARQILPFIETPSRGAQFVAYRGTMGLSGGGLRARFGVLESVLRTD